MIGDTIDGRYQVVRRLGEGGMGAVYEAIHAGTGRRVAIKVITHKAAQSPSTIERFEREAKAAGAIDSEHIAQVTDSGKDAASGLPYLVMELLLGEDLSQLLARVGPLRPELALRIAAQACLGLQKAHGARVMHRDIKPANLFLARRDEGEITVKILDFGVAKIKMEEGFAGGGVSLTRTSAVVGSPLYMSPEQARGIKDIDYRTDLWSLGVVLYKMLTGRAPHEDVDALGELIISICSEPARPVQDLAPWTPKEIAAVAHHALEIQRDDRFQRASAMLEAIKPLLPGGWKIHEDMLVPLDAADRAQVAARLDLTAAPHDPTEPQGPAARWTEPITAEIQAALTAATATTTAAPATAPAEATKVPSAKRGRATLAIVAGVAIAAGALIAGVWALPRAAPPAGASSAPAPSERAGAVVIDPEQLASFGPLPPVMASADNPLTDEKIKLGRELFFDPRLSRNQDLACASCHQLDAYGMDGKRASPGHALRLGSRNAPSVYNAAGQFALLWDGQASSVEEQASMPFARVNELATTEAQVEAALRAIPEYPRAFARAFPGDKAPLSFANLTRAIGAFERKLVTPGRWDRFLQGEAGALTEPEKAGFTDFVETGCVSCHFGPYVGGTMFQKVGLLKAWPNSMDRGRFEVTKKATDYMVFRVPSLRNVAKTAPYFHDGSVASLDEAIRMMARHQLGKELPPAKVASILTWLGALTGELPREYTQKPELPPSGPAMPRPEPE